MAERRCTYKCGDWNCASYQFNLYKDNIDQGDLCDVHYWQTRAQKAEALNQQPTAEDWVIVRCIYGWIKTINAQYRDPELVCIVDWYIKKVGKETLLAMLDEIKIEMEGGVR